MFQRISSYNIQKSVNFLSNQDCCKIGKYINKINSKENGDNILNEISAIKEIVEHLPETIKKEKSNLQLWVYIPTSNTYIGIIFSAMNKLW